MKILLKINYKIIMELKTLISRHGINLTEEELKTLESYYTSKIKKANLTRKQTELIQRVETEIFKNTEEKDRIYKTIVNLGIILTVKLVNTEISKIKKQITNGNLSYEDRRRLIEEKRKVIQDSLNEAREQYEEYKDYNSCFQLSLLDTYNKSRIARKFTKLMEAINRGETTLKMLDTFSKCLVAQQKIDSGIALSVLPEDEHDAYYFVMFNRTPERLIVIGGRRRDTD